LVVTITRLLACGYYQRPARGLSLKDPIVVFEHIPEGKVSMSDSSVLNPEAPASESSSLQLPISSIVRAVCEAATGGPDLLYEVMIKMSLMVEATAPTYGLSR
jgi:hypothetical protein